MYEIFFFQKIFIFPSQFSKNQNQFTYFLSTDVIKIVSHGYRRAWHPLTEQRSMYTFQHCACCQDEIVGWNNSSAAPDMDVIFAGLYPSVEEYGCLK